MSFAKRFRLAWDREPVVMASIVLATVGTLLPWAINRARRVTGGDRLLWEGAPSVPQLALDGLPVQKWEQSE